MKREKHEKKKVQIFELYSMLMSIGYAEISGTTLSVATTASQNG